MDEVYKELDEVKAEFEKLKAEYQVKAQLNESLMRAHTDQTMKIQEAQSQIERQAKELNAKSEEIAEVRQLYEDIKAKLHETECSLKQASQVREKFRIDTGEKMQNLEGENKKLTIALEEAVGRNEDLEKKLRARSEEVKGLKSLLSDTQRKCLEAEERARAGRELRQRDDVISRLEEQSMSIQDQLKWKKEQFAHLEDAHKRLQEQFQSSKKEWVSEKSLLLDEIATLQSKLDSQIRIAESLESRLKMCNQALAHEESRRKMLEVQLSESKQCFENVLAEYEEAKARVESLSTKRNEEIAGLRSQLGMKETLMKEMEYRVACLEQDNKELLGSVKELQEAQINKRKVDPSLAKLRSKLKDSEQVHSNCSLTLKEREAEWNSKMAQVIGDMKCYELDLKRQSEELHHLKMQLDDSHSAMEVCGEEISILLMVLKSELSNAYSRLFNSEVPIAAVSAKEMEMRHGSELKAPVCLEQARKEIASLTEKLDSLRILEERCNILEKELEEHKNMLEDSSSCQVRLKEQITLMEFALKNVSDTLEKSNSQLAVKISEANQAEVELQIWKSKAENLRSCLEQSEQMCKQMETSFLEQVEKERSLRNENESLQIKSKEQEQKIDYLLQKIATLDQKLAQAEASNMVMKSEVSEAQKKEVDYVQTIEARDATVDNLRKQIQTIEQQSASVCEAAESTRLEAEIRFECEKEKLYNITREKDECISCLQSLASSLEQNFMDMVLLSLSQGLEYLVKMNTLEDALKMTQSHMNSEMEIKNNAIDALQKAASDLRQTIEARDATVDNLRKQIKTIEQQSARVCEAAESTRLEAEIRFECEKETLYNITREKDECISCLQSLASSLEQNFMDMVLLSLSQGLEYLVKMNTLEDALKMTQSHMNSEMEIKNNAFDALQKEASDLRGQTLVQERSLLHSKQLGKELECLLEEKQLEMEILVEQFKNERVMLEERVKKLEREREAATENIERLSSERDSLLIYSEEICNHIGEVCSEDVKLELMLAKMLQNSQDVSNISDVISDQLCGAAPKDFVTCFTKEVESKLERSPLREIN